MTPDNGTGPRPDDGAPQPPRARRFVATKVEVEGREEAKIVELPDREPTPWGSDADLHVVGRRVPRMDALEKVTGAAHYTADLSRPGMLFAEVVRSPVAAGRFTGFDVDAVLAMPHVRGVLTLDDVRGIRGDAGQLLDDTIRYAGQPLFVVIADQYGRAKGAARAARPIIEPAPHAVTAEQALAEGAPKLRSRGNVSPRSPRVLQRGDVDAGLREADVTITREYRTPVALHSALEPHGAVAEWEGNRLTVWESTQGIFNTRRDLAAAFKLRLSDVRVMKDYMGGGFGAKNGASAAACIAAAASRKLGRPVRCVFDRYGEQTDAGNRSGTVQRVTIGAKRDGTLTAIRLDATVPLGVGGWEAGPGRIYHELHACPNVRTTETFVYTNAGAMASFRAPGHTEGAFGLESAMNALARELGIDPVELRLRNYAASDQARSRPYSAKRLDECYRAGAERFGWAQRDARRDHPSAPRVRRGFGMAACTWGAGGGPPAYATVRINRDGTVEVLTGAQDLGTGSRTVMAQIAAETLGARVDDVRTVLGDTERLPFASNSWGSITTASVGPAVRVAAEEARDRLFEAAAAMLDAGVTELAARDSVIAVHATGRSMTFAEVCGKLGDVMIMGQGSRGPNPDGTAVSAFGAQFAEVEVDTETGRVRVVRIVAAHDSGRIINPTLAESQLEGAVLQGMGYALFEERVMDAALGLPLNPSMHDYKIPTMADLPRIEGFFLEGADTVANHTGAKGLAEPPIIPVAPAIAAAVADAIGVECPEIPLTPWRVPGVLKD
ncbi:MAG TPA: xanthine dehydrogenase family protein molybdopterin-binding subunit [Gemmatimonadaceae bacterium]|nr:xanthine dehydrogenase family protein molybdopterin-binding subunit [Gemmatimonadaceae bacterium]